MTTNILVQMAAFFADKEGGSINVLKLMKLMYLADREAMHRYGFPISLDNMVSMQHGPVLSRALNLSRGLESKASQDIWDSWISDRENHAVELIENLERKDLDYISEADLEVLEFVWEKFGQMNGWELRDYTHEHCAEWKDPESTGRGSFPIEEIDVFRAVGIADEEATFLAKELIEQKSLRRSFQSLDVAPS